MKQKNHAARRYRELTSTDSSLKSVQWFEIEHMSKKKLSGRSKELKVDPLKHVGERNS